MSQVNQKVDLVLPGDRDPEVVPDHHDVGQEVVLAQDPKVGPVQGPDHLPRKIEKNRALDRVHDPSRDLNPDRSRVPSQDRDQPRDHAVAPVKVQETRRHRVW